MSNKPLPQQIYRHFKGDLYRIVTLAKNSETGEELAVYQALHGDYQVYATPVFKFLEAVDRVKYPHASQDYCFELCDELIRTPGTDSVQAAFVQGESVQGKSMAVSGRGEPAQGEAVQAVPGQGEPTQGEPAQGEAVQNIAGREPAQPSKMQEESEEELNIDPLVLEFLDADSYGERLNILAALHHRITDEMVNTMAVSIDLEIGEGDTEERYEELKSCLLTLERYECNRLR